MDTESSRRSSTPSITISEAFNIATGDFALISSDKTIFYVPRTVLQLSSKVFETMFEAGKPSSEDTEPIAMQATADELGPILKFAHPGHKNPVVQDASTLASLLRIAKQYEMDVVLDNLRSCLMQPRHDNDAYAESITVADPLTSLVICVAFDFEHESRFALREVIKCRLREEPIKAQNYDITLALMQRISTLRADRISWYMAKILELSEALINSCLSTISASSTNKDTAASHLAECIRWQHQAMKELEACPNFRTLKRLIYKGGTGALSHPIFRKSNTILTGWQFMEKWEVEATKLESELPHLEESIVG